MINHMHVNSPCTSRHCQIYASMGNGCRCTCAGLRTNFTNERPSQCCDHSTECRKMTSPKDLLRFGPRASDSLIVWKNGACFVFWDGILCLVPGSGLSSICLFLLCSACCRRRWLMDQQPPLVQRRSSPSTNSHH